MSRVVLFDLDGTLVRANTGRLYIRYELNQGRASLLQVGRVFFWLLKYALGLGNADMVAAQGLAWYRGRTEEEMRADMAIWFDRCVRAHISSSARRAVAAHQANGDVVAIATAGTRYVAEQVARELGIEHIICSEIEIVDGKISGLVLPPLCYGLGKVTRVRDWLTAQGYDASRGVVAYSDSITDLPLLEVAEVPHVINPDVRLRRVARRRGWAIESW